MKRKNILKSILFILFLGIMLYTGFAVGKKHEPIKTDVVDKTDDKKSEFKGDYAEVTADQTFKLLNLRKEVLEYMDLEQEELADALAEWTYKNGYSMATAAIFYPSMSIDFNTDIYSITLRLDDDVETVLNMEYYKEQKTLILKPIGPSVEHSQ